MIKTPMKANDEISSEAERTRNSVAAAEALYGEVLERFPEHVHALRGLADAHVLRELVDAVERQGVNSEDWSVIEAANRAHAGNFIEAAKSYLLHGLSDKSEKMLERALEYDPNNGELLWRRGEIHRAMGHFSAALDAYGQILALDPENQAAAYATSMLAGNSSSLDNAGAHWARGEAERAEGNLDAAKESYECLLEQNPENAAARYICAVLAGDAPVAAPPDCMPRPVPFVVIDSFLSAEEHDELLRMTDGLRESFKPSPVGNNDAKSPNIRKSQLVSKIENEEFVSWFAKRITEALAKTRQRLLIDSFNTSKVELQITTHTDGDFYWKHSDVGVEGSGTERRRISLVYYYHWQPKAFEGGDFLLHDLNRPTELGLTRIEPADNSMVFFPSEYLHEFTPVHCQGDDFRGGRFTVNGWVSHAG